MKVLYLTNLPAPYTVEFLTELGKHCDLTVVFERHSASDRDKKWVSEAKKTYKEIFLKGIKVGPENSICPGIKKLLKEKYDHVIIGMYSTFTAMMAIKYMNKKAIPYIISTDGGHIRENENPKKMALKTRLIGGAKAWLSTGRVADRYLMHYGAKAEGLYEYPFTSLKKEEILKTPVTDEKKAELRKKLGIEGEQVVIAVGRYIPLKRWEILAEAMRKFSNEGDNKVHCYLVGGEREELIPLLNGAEIPDNFHTIPFMKTKELFEYYQAADVFVMTTETDVWGLVVNEAMANGLPIISTVKCNAGVELVEEDVNGKLIPVGDSESLYSAVRELLSKPERLALMGENNLKKISSYTYEMMGVKVYEALLAIGSIDGN